MLSVDIVTNFDPTGFHTIGLLYLNMHAPDCCIYHYTFSNESKCPFVAWYSLFKKLVFVSVAIVPCIWLALTEITLF